MKRRQKRTKSNQQCGSILIDSLHLSLPNCRIIDTVLANEKVQVFCVVESKQSDKARLRQVRSDKVPAHKNRTRRRLYATLYPSFVRFKRQNRLKSPLPMKKLKKMLFHLRVYPITRVVTVWLCGIFALINSSISPLCLSSTLSSSRKVTSRVHYGAEQSDSQWSGFINRSQCARNANSRTTVTAKLQMMPCTRCKLS